MQLPAPADDSTLGIVPGAAFPADRHPVLVYLARLAPSSRRTMRVAKRRPVERDGVASAPGEKTRDPVERRRRVLGPAIVSKRRPDVRMPEEALNRSEIVAGSYPSISRDRTAVVC